MNKQDTSESFTAHKKRFGGKTIGGVVAVALAAIYSFAQPMLNDKFGLNLPGINKNNKAQVAANKGPDTQNNRQNTSQKNSRNNNSGASPNVQSGPLGDLIKPNNKTSNPNATGSKSGNSKQTSNSKPKTNSTAQSNSNLKYGLLKSLGGERYSSPEGLQYTRGSAEGHRLEHLRRHTDDQPGRPGSHGVFDGGMEGALKTIDIAYQKAKKNIKTTKKIDDGRTIYTVDMGKRVGYVGGRDGKRKRNPMARRVKIVLEGNRVITAYPL